jgi:hypothetical protein
MKENEMKAFHNLQNYSKCSIRIITVSIIAVSLLVPGAFAEDKAKKGDTKWTIHFRPGVRFGTDNRTLYIMDFLVPLHQGDKNILFANPKYTPNDVDGWEVNLGLGYRYTLSNNSLIFGINGLYDRKKDIMGLYS